MTKNADVTLRNEILVLLMFALSILLFLSNFKLCGPIGELLKNLTFGLFGIIGYIVPVLIIIATVYYIIKRKETSISAGKIVCMATMVVSVCTFTELLRHSGADSDMSIGAIYKTAMEGKGGGLIGCILVKILVPIFGIIASYVIDIVIFLIAVVLLTRFSITEAIKERSTSVARHANRDLEVRRERKKIRVQEREAMQQLKLDQERIDSERRLEIARKEQQARAGLGGLPLPSGNAADATVSKDGKVQNPVYNEVKKTKTGSFSVTYNNQTKIVSMDPDEDIPPIETIHGDIEEPVVRPVSDANSTSARPMRAPGTGSSEPSTVRNAVAAAASAAMGRKDLPSTGNVTPHTGSAQSGPSQSPRPSGGNNITADALTRSLGDDPDVKTIVTSSGRVITHEVGQGGQSKVPSMKREGEATIFEEVSAALAPVKPYIEPKEYVFPPISLLNKGIGKGGRNMDNELRENALKLQQTLQNFGVGVTVTNVSCGPTVTRYELSPEQGVKVSQIVRLQDDIKLNLAAPDIRIEAPIPGKAAIGIEIPNRESASVMLRDLLDTDDFRNASSKLSFGAGKDIGGQNIISDIGKMPHLLIAGATGSGKSVCINTIIMSILYKAKPSEVKLILIDPKVVELSVYNGIPHLMIPVVTDPKKASGALSWAVSEMTQRYKKFADLSVRDLKGYNEKIAEQAKAEPDKPGLRPLPQIVIIVDELADLMMVAPGEVEDSICRLAQMARAAGLHLILATQRPSVNVITGVIKANVPSRIAFSVSSGVDSRTILDMIGAEKLLGRGDMLYYPAGIQKPLRVQGAFVSDKEVSAVVEFLTKQKNVIGGATEEADEINQHIEASASGKDKAAESGNDAQEEDRFALDELFREAGLLLAGKDKCSIGMLQRAFRIGFNRAARIIDQLAEAGLVGEEEGTKPRRVLMTQEQFEQYCDENNISR
ncbi:MAG: DNA translocase FtsK 4TM domain-containing protein [Lachnospiraceae bacterium]|nr:DNA translocase FtsK 4TM domain-containing protein [Lachnospiraceae bacterium]